ncbi:MAG TPA: alpha-L-arabinofuranosidase C-terminal domain-containing protein [Actinospica sp.]|jgi:alpha-N-arabinofuranosidase|nr:alpha-L-arabinofuranosidase C-terminal domain-containing protein [Actinospica sp.]
MTEHGAAVVALDPGQHRGVLDHRLFGSFVEHMGRCVYTGIHEPTHPTADAEGFRGDVSALVRELGVTLVRYPGGNFVSGYDWRDGIGPREQRPRRLDLAWRSIETNQVGTDEFMGWARARGVEPMMAVNLGTGGVLDAAALVEYCNVPEGTEWSERRRRNGALKPHEVKLWCLGNEMDGPWQTGHTTAEQYGALAAETAKAMRLVDPDIELVACGSSSHDMPTFGYWESAVLEAAGEYVDYISMHAYYQEHDGDRDSFLASGASMDSFIEDVVATIDAVAARRRTKNARRVDISFDEWNVWYQSRYPGTEAMEIDVAGPRIEDQYSALDAVVVGDLLSSLVNHADRVKIGCLAQLVNVIAPIMTAPGGAVWRQPTFHPFAAVASAARGHSLVTRVQAAELSTRRYGDVPAVAAAATHDPATGDVAVFLTNRAAHPVAVDLRHRDFQGWTTMSAQHLAADDRGPRDHATAADVGLTRLDTSASADGHGTALTLPPHSWTIVRAATPGTES